MNWQKLRQLLIVFMAGIFLLVTTACGAPSTSEAPEGEQAQPEAPTELSSDAESEKG